MENPKSPDINGNKKIKSVILNLLGLILVVGAAVLYWRDIKMNKEQANAANVVRFCASSPMMAMGLMLDSTGSARNVFMGCPPPVVSNIVSMLMKAEPTSFPKGTVEGDEYQIFMMFTNRTQALMRAVRLYDDPENLYVGIRQPLEFDENKKPIAWGFSPPALVVGLGTVFQALASNNIPVLREQAPKLEAAMTNFTQQALAAGTNQPVKSDSPLNAWMNSTNAPAAPPAAAPTAIPTNSTPSPVNPV